MRDFPGCTRAAPRLIALLVSKNIGRTVRVS
jgi:hypothetical protein